jgi:hypothetical protein
MNRLTLFKQVKSLPKSIRESFPIKWPHGTISQWRDMLTRGTHAFKTMQMKAEVNAVQAMIDYSAVLAAEARRTENEIIRSLQAVDRNDPLIRQIKIRQIKNPIHLTEPNKLELKRHQRAIKDLLAVYVIECGPITDSYTQFLDVAAPLVIKKLDELKSKMSFKFNLSYEIITGKPDNDTTEKPFFAVSDRKVVTQAEDTVGMVVDANTQIIEKIEELLTMGSGFVFIKGVRAYLNVAKFAPFHGSKHLIIPAWLRAKKALVNVKNNDDYCFAYSIEAGIKNLKKHPERPNKYNIEKYLKDFEYPAPLKESWLTQFEKTFDVSVNIYGLENTNITILRITKEEKPSHHNLLFVGNRNVNHYCLIKSMSRLLTHRHGQAYVCNTCLHPFTSRRAFDNHQAIGCAAITPVRTVLPKEGTVMKFINTQYTERMPIFCTADFECILKKCPKQQDELTTINEEEHTACGYAIRLVSKLPDIKSETFLFRGKEEGETVRHFANTINEISTKVMEVYGKKERMIITKEQQHAFDNAKHCYICGGKFDDDLYNPQVRDHDHITGKYLGAAHSRCNLKRSQRYKFLPVIFHNLRGYDGHLIITEIARLCKKIKVIPNNMEKYMSFTGDGARFIDSMQFMASSLSSLVDNLASGNDYSKFGHMFDHFAKYGEDTKMLIRKGVYPYEWFDSFNKFNAPCKWDINDFYSNLTGEIISKTDYEHYLKVVDTFNLKTAGEYHDLYLLTDVLLLADVWENFCATCHKYYGLDPCWYYTAPGMSWDAALKMTGIKLELLTDPDMHIFFENGMRGGMSTVSHRYAAANNKYMTGYDKSKESSYLMYLDANNLYGYGMSSPLPYAGFRWVDTPFEDMFDDPQTGYVLEVDLEYPKELHDAHNDYPLAPEQMTIKKSMLSEFTTKLKEFLGNKTADSKMLVGNLYNKKNYVVHYETLRLYTSLGMKITKVHRVLQFDQKPWLKEYIDFNTNKRKEAKNSFEKDFFKLMNNSCYGKTMENVRKHIKVEICNTKERVRRLVAKPSFKSFKIFTDDVAAVHNDVDCVKLDKPIYVGFAVLERSKELMFDFHYNTMKAKYGDNIRLCFTDTDSLCYHIKTEDVYADFATMGNLFDFSEYPKTHPLYNTANAKIIGKFKDECGGKIMTEFVGLRSKMYSYTVDGDSKSHIRAKGVGRAAQKSIKHENYKNAIFSTDVKDLKQYATMYAIRSQEHKLFTVKQTKISLSVDDGKRFILDGINTAAHGHYRNIVA